MPIVWGGDFNLEEHQQSLRDISSSGGKGPRLVNGFGACADKEGGTPRGGNTAGSTAGEETGRKSGRALAKTHSCFGKMGSASECTGWRVLVCVWCMVCMGGWGKQHRSSIGAALECNYCNQHAAAAAAAAAAVCSQ
jgi:hypothetical protein